MSKREKIILAVMVLVVIYGVYSLFFASAKKIAGGVPKKNPQEINQFVMGVAARLSDEASTKQAHVLALAKSEWPRDPFLALKPPEETRTVVETVAPEKLPEETFTYSGYLQMGDRTLAIINGIEYETGDRLEKDGSIVKKIGPERVVIGPRSNRGKDRTLKLEESK